MLQRHICTAKCRGKNCRAYRNFFFFFFFFLHGCHAWRHFDKKRFIMFAYRPPQENNKYAFCNELNETLSKAVNSYKKIIVFFSFFFNWYSLHARLNSHYEAWSYKKKKHKKVKAYRKSI